MYLGIFEKCPYFSHHPNLFLPSDSQYTFVLKNSGQSIVLPIF
jgi:hypothetical protein